MIFTKICKKCGIEKNNDEFRIRYYKDSNKQYTLNTCKKCELEYKKNHRKENINIALKKEQEKRNKKNKETLEKEKEQRHEWYLKNRNTILQQKKKYQAENKDKIRKYCNENKDKIAAKNKRYREKNKEKLKIKHQEKMNNDKTYRFKNTIRNMLRLSFRRKGKTKYKHSEEMLCCSIDEFINHLIYTYEKKYNEKWKWEYLNKVHIDHIIPLATVNTEEEIIKLCHYKNLQLLKAEDNLKKSCKVVVK